MEALAFAGHFKLDNLVLIYDSNDVTLDAMAVATQSENACQRFEIIGFNVIWVQHGNDIVQIAAAIDLAVAFVGKPTVIILRTQIGKGIAEVAGTSKAHGEGGATVHSREQEEARSSRWIPFLRQRKHPRVLRCPQGRSQGQACCLDRNVHCVEGREPRPCC